MTDVFDVGICGHDPRKQNCPKMKHYRDEGGRLDLRKYALAHPNKPVANFNGTWPQFLSWSARQAQTWSSGITTASPEEKARVKSKGRSRTNNVTNSGMLIMDGDVYGFANPTLAKRQSVRW